MARPLKPPSLGRSLSVGAGRARNLERRYELPAAAGAGTWTWIVPLLSVTAGPSNESVGWQFVADASDDIPSDNPFVFTLLFLTTDGTAGAGNPFSVSGIPNMYGSSVGLRNNFVVMSGFAVSQTYGPQPAFLNADGGITGSAGDPPIDGTNFSNPNDVIFSGMGGGPQRVFFS